MRSVLALACLVLLTSALAGCSAGDPERFPDGVSSGTSTSQAQTTSGSATSTSASASSTATTTGPAGNGSSDLPPTANVTATPVNGTAPLNVTFTLSGSDPEGGDLTWEFLFGDGNKTNGTSLPVTVVHEFAKGGNYTPTLTVSDGNATTTASTNVTVDGGAGGLAPGLDPACQRPAAVGNDNGFWVDHRGGDSIWAYEESNGIPGLQLGNGVSPIPPPVGGHTDPLGANCLNGDTFLF